MKLTLLTPLFICASLGLFAQGVGIGTDNPSPSSMLDVQSDTSGVLLPRMTDQNIGR
jgi:hypothetical protein